MKSSIVFSLFVAQFCLSACAAENDKPKLVLSDTQPAETPLIPDAEYQPKVKQKMKQQQQVDFAKQALVERLGIELDQISVIQVTAVTWRSGALGCPAADRMYTQALVPGVLIVLSAENKTYRYHASQFGSPFFCADDQAESTIKSPNDRF